MRRFEIWWSPFDAGNGRKVIEAKNKQDAELAAFAEMRRHGSCGAYGAVEVTEGGE
jgi:hypothetical protein